MSPDEPPQLSLPPVLSIVVPALDEQDNIAPLVEQVRLSVVEAGIAAELIIVDDGSRDGTLARLIELAGRHPWLTPLHRDRPQGQSSALAAGIKAARGAFIATLDADLQNDPADLLRLLAVVREQGADLAQGDRVTRRDSRVRRFSSWVGRTTSRLLLGDAVRDTGCSTRVMRSEYARRLPLQFRGMHRFIPACCVMLGARIVEVPVNHRPRTAGLTKYGMSNRALVGLLDCLAVRWMKRRYRDGGAEPVRRTEHQA